MTQNRVAVIGAGPTGLVCARECIREGLDVQVFEKAKVSGGLWNLEKAPTDLQQTDVFQSDYNELSRSIHSSIYDDLRTNLPREVMGFMDYPFDTNFSGSFDSRMFPERLEVLNFIEAFKTDYNLDKYISYQHEVVKVKPIGKGQELKWEVHVKSSDEIQELNFDAVFICNGHFNVPNIPKVEGIQKFGKPCVHAHLYRNPEPYKDKIVLVLGNGPSGMDMAIDIGEVAKTVYLCGKKWEPQFDLSKSIGKKNNIKLQCKASQCISEGTIQLEDGTILDGLDVILFCTGYHYDFPFLEPKDIVSTANGHVYPVYLHCIHPHYPSLFFIGLNRLITPGCVVEYQSRYCAKIVSRKCQLPSSNEMMEEINANYLRLKEKNLTLNYYHVLLAEQFPYLEKLSAVSGDPSEFPGWFKELYHYRFGVLHIETPFDYRDSPFPQELMKRVKTAFETTRTNNKTKTNIE